MCEVYLEKKAAYVVVTLRGELILGCTGEIKEKVKAYAQEHQLYRLVVDLSQVSFIDSSGLGALIAWFKMANQEQGKVVFCAPSAQVGKVIGYAKLDKIFNIADSIEAAEKAVLE